MTFVSGNIARTSNLLLSQIGIGNIGRTNLSMFRATTQLSTGRALLRPSDDIVKAAAILELDDRLERNVQTRKNLDFANAQVSALDTGLGEVGDLLEQARSIALTQISEGPDADERRAQSVVIQSIIDSMFGVTNREGVSGFIFGGSTPGRQPIEESLGAYRMRSARTSLRPDTPGLGAIPITIGAPEAVRGTGGQVLGKVDLQPQLTDSTRLDDLQGGRGLGVTSGSLAFSFEGGTTQTIDLTSADTIGDVIDAIEAGIRQYEQDTGETVLGPGGVAISGRSIAIDSPFGTLTFSDLAGGVVARDLGLVETADADFNPVRSVGADLAPRVTTSTPINQLAAIGSGLGAIRISNNGHTVDVDLSGAETIGEIKSRIESAGLGLSVEINADGTGIDVINEVAAGSGAALSISEIDGNNDTAAALGIRTFSAATRAGDLNFGRGVRVADGHPDPTYNVDFVLTVDDAAGNPLEIPIDLTPADLTTIGAIADTINDQIDAALTAAGRPTTDLSVSIESTTNGLVFNQDPSITAGSGDPLRIERRNNSLAAIDLGITDGTWDAGTSRWVGTDKSKVRVESVFTHLIDLRTALEDNDDFGMQLAVESLEDAIDEVTKTRALVGGYGKRIERQITRQEDRQVLDEQVRSTLRDVDFAKAASEFSLLQVQLQAGLQTAAISGQLTLLNFL
jgi:flagellin-like hook-associated protein FlgL